MPILSLPHQNTALEKTENTFFQVFFLMCGLTFSVIKPEFKLRMHFSKCFLYFLLFLQLWLMWTLAYSSQLPKNKSKSNAWETFAVLPFKGQIPIITSWWSAKWRTSFISGTVQSGGQCLHSLWKLVSWQSIEDFPLSIDNSLEDKSTDLLLKSVSLRSSKM